jgi:hypothetical protein
MSRRRVRLGRVSMVWGPGFSVAWSRVPRHTRPVRPKEKPAETLGRPKSHATLCDHATLSFQRIRWSHELHATERHATAKSGLGKQPKIAMENAKKSAANRTGAGRGSPSVGRAAQTTRARAGREIPSGVARAACVPCIDAFRLARPSALEIDRNHPW